MLSLHRNVAGKGGLLHTNVVHCTQYPIYVFPEMKLRDLVPISYIHVSLSDLYIPRISVPFWLQQNILKIVSAKYTTKFDGQFLLTAKERPLSCVMLHNTK